MNALDPRNTTPPDAATAVRHSRPQTGDLVIDAALEDLDAIAADDLDAVIVSGEAVHRTLTSRLADLGG